VLQERQVVRIGSRKPIAVELRLIAATNVDLDKAVDAGHFRADLFYRLSVASVQLPPLQERSGDILPLAQHFVEVYRAKLGMPEATISARACQALLEYDWPGNIRELENVIHYALIVSNHGVIEHHDLRLGRGHGSHGRKADAQPAASTSIASQFNRLFDAQQPDLYRHVEEELVRSAFAYCSENQVRTARLLGISRNILRAQLKRFGMLPSRLASEDEHESLVATD
jgi:sigma-54-specific transcriptional regulator